MNILLIGHSIIDHLEKSGKQTINPGGIYYNSLGLSAVKSCNDEIYLLTNLTKKNFSLFEKPYSKVNKDYITISDEMPEVILKIFDDRERDEIYTNTSSNLPITIIDNWEKFNGILINMITGFDISTDHIKMIRNNFNGLIYFDVLTLARGVDENLKREFRIIPEVEQWLINIDILQCNENELHSIFDFNEELSIVKKYLNFVRA